MTDDGTLRAFDTGATRDTSEGKLDYEGFLSPEVLLEFAKYMQKHRVQSDGELRSSDNWQKGMPKEEYMKSMWRHFMDVWRLHRGLAVDTGVDKVEALCALLFNVQGLLFEVLRTEPDPTGKRDSAPALNYLYSTVQPSPPEPGIYKVSSPINIEEEQESKSERSGEGFYRADVSKPDRGNCIVCGEPRPCAADRRNSTPHTAPIATCQAPGCVESRRKYG